MASSYRFLYHSLYLDLILVIQPAHYIAEMKECPLLTNLINTGQTELLHHMKLSVLRPILNCLLTKSPESYVNN